MAAHAPVFGPEYIIPKPFDPRLILQIAPAVARAAMAAGVATRPIDDFAAYRERARTLRVPLRPAHAPGVRGRAQDDRQRIVYAEGEDERVLRAVQTLVDDEPRRAHPDRPPRRDRQAASREWACASSLDERRAGARPRSTTRTCSTRWSPHYQRLVGRRGVPPDAAARRMLRRPTVAAAMLLQAGQVGRRDLRRHAATGGGT